MKNIKRIKHPKVSPYYAAIMHIAAMVTVVIVAIVGISSLFAPFAYNWVSTNFSTNISTWSFLLAGLVTLGGGFGISLLISRKTEATRDERIIKAGAFGSLAYLVYTVTFGVLLLLDVTTTNMVQPYLTAIGPILALVITAVAALIERRSVPFLRIAMGTFVTAFWLSEVLSTIQGYRYIGASREAMMGSIWVWFQPLLYVLIPLVIIGILYFSLRNIGRLARVFYPTYIYALAFNLMLSLSALYWNPEANAATAYMTFTLIVTLCFLGSVLLAFIRARRLK